jgi:hypothetical protein
VAKGARRPATTRRSPARTLCKPFEGTALVGCARPGLAVLERHHTAIVTSGTRTACGVHLDLCRKPHEPDAPRWDYLFTMRDGESAIGVEVHPADANEVDAMIAKKTWAAELLSSECPALQVERWIWLAPPSGAEIMLLPQHPNARRLAEAQIEFPKARYHLP